MLLEFRIGSQGRLLICLGVPVDDCEKSRLFFGAVVAFVHLLTELVMVWIELLFFPTSARWEGMSILSIKQVPFSSTEFSSNVSAEQKCAG
jgi:hypothetical protein